MKVLPIGKLTPIDVTLEITRECPLRCIFCSSNGGLPHPNELSLAEWKCLVDESIEIGARSFLISGGEPFTSPYIRELSRYISKKSVELSIYSSGNVFIHNRLNPIPLEDLKYISDLGTIRMVLSLEAASDKTHDLITCQKGSYINALKTIKNCVDIGLKTEVHFVPTKLNYRELSEVVALSKSLGVDQVSILRFVPQGRGYDNREALELDNEDLSELKSIFSDLTIYDDFVRIGSPFNPFLLSKQYRCTAGTNRLTVRYDGLVVPCEAFKFWANTYSEDIDVRKNSLKEIWTNSALFIKARKLHHLNWDFECYSCSDLEKCGGGCPAQKILTGSLKNLDPYCMKKIIQSVI